MSSHRISYSLLSVSLALLALGVIFLSTLSAPESLRTFGNTTYYLFHQLVIIAIGIVLAAVVMKLPLSVIKKWALPVLVFNLLLMLAVALLPHVGVKLLGAKRWLSIGGITVQPSEFLKFTAVVFMAAWLSEHHAQRHRRFRKHLVRSIGRQGARNAMRVFLPFVMLLVAVAFLMMLQRDISTLGIITVALIAVYFAAETPFWHTLAALAGEAGGFFLLIKFEPYRLQRFLTLLHPGADPLGVGYQLKQSLIAVGSGRIFGKGLGMSTEKFGGHLPQAMGDSVFAILGEETGLVGSMVIVLLFMIFFWQIMKIALRSQDAFGRLAAVGIGTWLILQTFMNMASAVGIFPLSGIPLPFFSYGGSHILAELAAIGLLLNISKHAHR